MSQTIIRRAQDYLQKVHFPLLLVKEVLLPCSFDIFRKHELWQIDHSIITFKNGSNKKLWTHWFIDSTGAVFIVETVGLERGWLSFLKSFHDFTLRRCKVSCIGNKSAGQMLEILRTCKSTLGFPLAKKLKKQISEMDADTIFDSLAFRDFYESFCPDVSSTEWSTHLDLET
jgi:hypothetical protein